MRWVYHRQRSDETRFIACQVEADLGSKATSNEVGGSDTQEAYKLSDVVCEISQPQPPTRIRCAAMPSRVGDDDAVVTGSVFHFEYPIS
jgi:hypothetical protein